MLHVLLDWLEVVFLGIHWCIHQLGWWRFAKGGAEVGLGRGLGGEFGCLVDGGDGGVRHHHLPIQILISQRSPYLSRPWVLTNNLVWIQGASSSWVPTHSWHSLTTLLKPNTHPPLLIEIKTFIQFSSSFIRTKLPHSHRHRHSRRTVNTLRDSGLCDAPVGDVKFLRFLLPFIPFGGILHHVPIHFLIRLFLVPYLVLLPARRLVMRLIVDKALLHSPFITGLISDYQMLVLLFDRF